MAITFTKSKLLLILIIVFTVLVSAGAIVTAVLLQQRSIGGSKSKASTATCPFLGSDVSYLYHLCTTNPQPFQGIQPDGMGYTTLASATSVDQYINAGFRVHIRDENGNPVSHVSVDVKGAGKVGKSGLTYATTNCTPPGSTSSLQATNNEAMTISDSTGVAMVGGVPNSLNCFNAPYNVSIDPATLPQGYQLDTKYAGNGTVLSDNSLTGATGTNGAPRRSGAGGACIITNPSCSNSFQTTEDIDCKIVPIPTSTPKPPTPTPPTPTLTTPTPPVYQPNAYVINTSAVCDNNQSLYVNVTGYPDGVTRNTKNGTYSTLDSTQTFNLKADAQTSWYGTTVRLTDGPYSGMMINNNGKNFIFHYVGCIATPPPPPPTTVPGKCKSLSVPNKLTNQSVRQMPTVNIQQSGDASNGDLQHVYRPDNGYDYATGIAPTWSGTQPSQYWVHYAVYTASGAGTKLTPTWSTFAVPMNFTTNSNSVNGNGSNLNFNPTIPMIQSSFYDANAYAFGYLITDSGSLPTISPPNFPGDTSVDPCYTYVYVQRPICSNIGLSYNKDSVDGTHKAGDVISSGSTVSIGDALNVGPVTWKDNKGAVTQQHPTYIWNYGIINSSGVDSGIISVNQQNAPTIISNIPSGIKKAYYTITTFDTNGSGYVLKDPNHSTAWENPLCYTEVNVVAPKPPASTPSPTPTITQSPTPIPTASIPPSYTFGVKALCDNNPISGSNFAYSGDKGSTGGVPSTATGLQTPRSDLPVKLNETITIYCGSYFDNISGTLKQANSSTLVKQIGGNGAQFVCQYSGCLNPTPPVIFTPSPTPTSTSSITPSGVPSPTPVPTNTFTPTLTPTLTPTPPPAPVYQCNNTSLSVVRNSSTVYLTRGSTVKPGEVLTITVSGNSYIVKTGYDLTVQGGSGSSDEKSQNPGIFTYTTPTTGTGLNIVGYARNPITNAKIFNDLCNFNVVVEQPVPQIQIDKVAIYKNTTAITGNTYPDNRCIGVQPGCRSQNLSNGDKVTYKLLVKNVGQANLTNVVVQDNLTLSGGGSAEFDISNGTNTPANKLRKCTDTPNSLTNGVCSGYSSQSYDYSQSYTFPIPSTAAQPHIQWVTIPTMAPNDVYEAEIKIKATSTADYSITNNLHVSTDTFGTYCSKDNSTNGCFDSIVHVLNTPAVPLIFKDAYSVGGTTSQHDFNPGDTVQYGVTIRNTGTSQLTGLTIKDHPTSFFSTYFDTSTFNGTLTTPNATIDGNGDIVWSGVSVNANSDTVLKFSIKLLSTIAASAPNCVVYFPNIATITSGTTGTPSTQSPTVISIKANVCGESSLALIKTASPAQVSPGGTMGITLTVKNYSSVSASIKELTDYLPDGFTYAGNLTVVNHDGTNGTGTESTNGNNLVFAINSGTGDPVGSTQSMNINFQIKATSTNVCNSYRNVASVTNPLGPSGYTDIVICKGVYVLPNTGKYDGLILSMLVSGGMLGVSYWMYKYDMVDKLNLYIKLKKRKK